MRPQKWAVLAIALLLELGAGDKAKGDKTPARDLDPAGLKSLVRSLEEYSDSLSPGTPRMALLDLSQHGVYSKVWDKFAKAGLAKGVVMARLNCATHYDFCSDKLEVSPWNDMRLYFSGDTVSPNGHVPFPAGLLTRQNTNKGGEGLDYVKQFLNAESRDAAAELSRTWKASIREKDLAEPEGNTAHDGLVRVTGGNLESVMATALHNPIGQVFVLYTGTYEDCSREVKAMRGALELLEEEVKTSVTLAVVNCDVHHEPCEAASLGVYCFANHFTKENACPHNIGGPKGNAIFDDKLTPKKIAKAIQQRMPHTEL